MTLERRYEPLPTERDAHDTCAACGRDPWAFGAPAQDRDVWICADCDTANNLGVMLDLCGIIPDRVGAEAGMPARPDVLDGIRQYLLLRDLRPHLDLVYHDEWSFVEFVKFIKTAPRTSSSCPTTSTPSSPASGRPSRTDSAHMLDVAARTA